MRSIFAIVITFFLLTACSQTPITQTQIPTIANTNTPLPTQIPVPAPTFTATPTVVKFDADTWGQMSEIQKLAAVPKSDEYTVGIVSTLDGKGNYVSVNDPKTGEMTGAWNSQIGKVETIAEAGFIVLSLNDGTKYEMPYFGVNNRETATPEERTANIQRTVDYMSRMNAWGTAGQMGNSPELHSNQNLDGTKMDLLSREDFTGARVFFDGNPQSGSAFEIYLIRYGSNQALATFMDKDWYFHSFIIDDNYEVIAGMMGNKKVFAPDPD